MNAAPSARANSAAISPANQLSTAKPTSSSIAGLAAGFLVGRARPLRIASGGGVLQLLTALSGLLASGSAQAAAVQAGDAADAVEAAATPADSAIRQDAA